MQPTITRRWAQQAMAKGHHGGTRHAQRRIPVPSAPQYMLWMMSCEITPVAIATSM